MDTARVLELAAVYLELNEWRQGAENLRNRGLCVAEAVGRADALNALQVALGGEPIAPYIGPIVRWNDTPGRTKEEVIAMLRAVAASERARAAMPAARDVAQARKDIAAVAEK